jgi:hypothetical protein
VERGREGKVEEERGRERKREEERERERERERKREILMSAKQEHARMSLDHVSVRVRVRPKTN